MNFSELKIHWLQQITEENDALNIHIDFLVHSVFVRWFLDLLCARDPVTEIVCYESSMT